MVKILSPNDEDINNILQAIDTSLSKLDALKNDYSDCASTLSSNISTLDYGGWEDDVQKMFISRTDTFKTELDKIQMSVDSTHLNVLISKLNDLRTELQNIKTKNARYERYESYTDDDDSWIWDDGKKEWYVIIDGSRYNNDSYDALCRRAFAQIDPHIDNANKLIEYISSISFDSSIDSEDDISALSISNTSENSSESTTTTETIASYRDFGTGWYYNVTMTTTESQDQKIIERNIVCTDNDGNVVNTENITITIDKNDPRVIRVDDDGEVYETRVNEDGQLVEVEHGTDKHGNSYTEETPISGENGYQVSVTNENTGETTTYAFATGSNADFAMFRMIYENARMQEGYLVESAWEGINAFTFGGEDSVTVRGFGDSKGITITVDRE